MNQDHVVTAKNILKTIIYTTIATVNEDGMPTAAPQFTVYNYDSRTFYWCAARTSQHAQNILREHNAYVVAYDAMAAPGEGEGVYAQAAASEVTDLQEQVAAHAQLIEKHAGVPYWELEDVRNPDSPVTIFKAQVTQAWINNGREENGHFVIYREPITL